MTKEEAMKLALEGAANYIDALGGDSRKYRQALAEQPAQQEFDVDRLVELARADERRAMMQLFTDPENQPTQHGTVTLEYMQREIADEREACARLCDEQQELVGAEMCCVAMNCAAAIRARSKHEL